MSDPLVGNRPTGFNPDYHYVIKDIRRVGILAGSFISCLGDVGNNPAFITGIRLVAWICYKGGQVVRQRWPYATKLTISLLLLAFFIYLLTRFREIVPPIIIAVIIAYILNPIVNFIQNKVRLPRA